MRLVVVSAAFVATVLASQVVAAQNVAPAPAPPPAVAPVAPAPAPAPVDPAAPVPAPVAPAEPPAPAPAPVAPAPVAPAPAAAPPGATMAAPAVGNQMLKRYTSWDANIEGGVGRVLTGPGETTGLVRARAGVLVIRDPSFFAVGATYELSHLSAATLGVQAEYLNLESGFWGQIGPLVDVAAERNVRLGFMASAGISVFGVEYQGRDYNSYGFSSAIFAKLRIPLGIIGFGIRGR
jgi:hypothetical protein